MEISFMENHGKFSQSSWAIRSCDNGTATQILMDGITRIQVGTVYWSSVEPFARILLESPAGSRWSLHSRVHSDFSWSLHLEQTNLQVPPKTLSNLMSSPSLSTICLPHHNKPHSYRTAENKEAILINLIIIYLFILVLKKWAKMT